MLQFERISQQSPVFVENISALRKHQPDLADRLQAVDISESIKSTVGRDGLPVVVLGADEHRIAWLGGSSMPSISAPAVLAGFIDQGVSVALPSVGTGYECLQLLARLQRHCAVFVCEQSTERLAAALCVIDFSERLAGGRLVLLDGDVEQSLPEFIDQNSGYDFPTQLFALPDMDAAAFKTRTDAVHRACHIAGDRQHRHINRLATQIVGSKGQTHEGIPHIAIVSVDAAGGSVEHAARIGRALEELGWSYSVSVPDHPQSCSVVSRVRALADQPIDFVLVINGTLGRLSEYLPADVPVACWFLDCATLPSAALDGLGEAVNLVAASKEVERVMIARGARCDCVRVIEKGVDHVLFDPGVDSGRRTDTILVLVDGEDLSPKAAHIGLESHERLWSEMQRLLVLAADRKKQIDLPGLLQKAERDTGVRLNDDHLRQQFLAIVAGRMTKTIIARTAVEAMASDGFDLDLYGRNWASHKSVSSLQRCGIPDAQERSMLYGSAGCVVFPYADTSVIQYCLEAVASGCLPMIRCDGNDIFGHYLRARTVLEEVPRYGTNTELVADLRKWVTRSEERGQLVAVLRSNLLKDQKVTDRLAEIRGWLCK